MAMQELKNEELDIEIDDEDENNDSKSDRLNSQNQTYNFDTTTLIVSMQILPSAEETRQVLITAGVKGEPPVVVNATLSQITQSAIIAQALEQLKQALPQIGEVAAKRAVASKTFNSIKAKIPLPDLPVPSTNTQSSQLSLFN